MDDSKKALLKSLPKIDEVMNLLRKRDIYKKAPKNIVKITCRAVVESLRDKIIKSKGGKGGVHIPEINNDVVEQVAAMIDDLHKYRLRRVVNATGIILHTNLGRAPLCDEALARITEIGGGYSNLEYNLATGERGLRYDHVQRLLCALSGAEDALVVNNNAAAVLLVLNTLAERKEAIVSRGELIEIGGEFRIPEIMKKSGAILREVGTTNRTHLADYETAIGEKTGLIMKVHTSNYRIVGFTEEISLAALVKIGEKFNLPVVNDLGSGCFLELDRYGLTREPTVHDALKAGADVVTLSGDKLLGGPQAGIILGKKAILKRIKSNPLNRALRIDKLTLAALEATMMQYLNPERAATHLRVLRSLTESVKIVEKRGKSLLTSIRKLQLPGLTVALKKGASLAGGGSLPTEEIQTLLLGIKSNHLSANMIEERLRHLDVPIIARIEEDEVLMDLRTIDESEFSLVIEGLKSVIESS